MKEEKLIELIESLDLIHKGLFSHDRFLFTIHKNSNKSKFNGLGFCIKKSDMDFINPTMEIWFMHEPVLFISYDIENCNLAISSCYPYIKNKKNKDIFFMNALINKENLNDEFLHKKLHLKCEFGDSYDIQISTLLKNIRDADKTMFIS